MSILKTIVDQKYKDLSIRKQLVPERELLKKLSTAPPPRSLVTSLHAQPYGVIAEYKRKSPSAGVINDRLSPAEVALSYQNAGAAGLSVLTDGPFFGGDLSDLEAVRTASNLPVLRKDFMVDEYQLLEARAYGADVILLIAAVLDSPRVEQLASAAHRLGLEVLLEIHNEAELDRIGPDIDLVGVNNRNLSTFEVSLENSARLSASIPDKYVRIAESGIKSSADLTYLKDYGFSGYLVGGSLMAEPDPGQALKSLMPGSSLNVDSPQ